MRKEVEPPNKYEELESNTSEDWTADINEALERTHSADTARDTVKGIFISIIYIGLNAYLSVTNKWLFQSEVSSLKLRLGLFLVDCFLIMFCQPTGL